MNMIFEPFRQASEGLGRKFEGSGLGLTLCKRFVELMNGKISVESRPGRGSSFILKFPLPKGTEKTRIVKTDGKAGEVNTEKLAEQDWSGPKPHILIVEDNPLNCELTELYIADVAFVDKAFEGHEALVLAKSRVYDAVLMDIHLSSEMDGLQVTKELRKMPGYDSIPIIAVTGYSTAREREHILSGGLTHFLAKPFAKEVLRNLLWIALEGRKSQGN